MAVSFERFRELILALPGVDEHPSYGGAPAYRVRRNFLAWLREEGVICLRTVDLVQKDFLLDTQPDVFYTTPHYDGYPAVLIRLERADESMLRELVEETWRSRAPRKLVAELENRAHG